MVLKKLSSLKENEEGRIADIEAGRELKMRLIAMGFSPKSKIRMVRNSGKGPVVVEIKGTTRVVLGRGMADKIKVETEK